ncbi:xanthine dehydrogenase family protein subunit M [Pseudonocardia eucalypti]|uniref:Xanthine dehydrogenase family protein subunit M n=1 Tax=Pseudonocardia eucalypti TaxID=648755 RepID=A0ABP9QMT7_9PSEU|nr:carbon-monoxide dehydrogenase medium subunit [Pseudonocardia eucalypti]
MKSAPFDYLRARDVPEVVAALAGADGEGKILAGGQSLVPVLALRMARPVVLVDINHVAGLSGVVREENSVRVGALTRHSELTRQTQHPLLAEAARWIGHTAIRTRGTAGGSIAHADPSAELPAVAVATGASVAVAGPSGDRCVAAEELFAGPLMTTLAEEEIITAVTFPRPTRWGFAEFARRHGDFALVTAVVAEVGGEVRIALGGVGAVPVRASAAEASLAVGGGVTGAVDALAGELHPTADLHGSTEYRRAVAVEMVRRALADAGIN